MWVKKYVEGIACVHNSTTHTHSTVFQKVKKVRVVSEESPNDLFYSADGHGVLSSQALPLLHQLIVQFARAEHDPGHIVPRHFVWYHSLETSTFTESHEYTTAQLGSNSL